MTAVCYKPAGHVWTLCHIVREHGEGEGEPYFSVPCVVAVTARPTVQSPNLEGSAAVIGWELAEFMAGTCNTWSLSRLRFVADGPLKYTITGADVAAAILEHGERVRTLRVSQVGKDSVPAELRAMLSTKRRRTKGPASSGDGAPFVEIEVEVEGDAVLADAAGIGESSGSDAGRLANGSDDGESVDSLAHLSDVSADVICFAGIA